jgi:hypothetical protein
MSLSDISGTIYGFFFVATATAYGLWKIFQHGVHKSIEEHLIELREELRPIMEMMSEMDKRTSRIEYALYNDGKTGLINKVEELLENQQSIKVDVEVMKAMVEQ